MGDMTVRQKLAIAKVVENQGNVSRSMREAGYPATTAKNPSNLTNSKAWHELMSEKLPDEKVLDRHSEALDALKQNEYTGEVIPDHPIRLKAVDLAYKLKNRYQVAVQILNQGDMEIQFVK